MGPFGPKNSIFRPAGSLLRTFLQCQVMSLDLRYLLSVPRVPVVFKISLGEDFLSLKNSLSPDFGRFLRFEWVLYRVRHYLIHLTVLKQQIYLLLCKNKTKFNFLKRSVFNKTLETNDVAVKKKERGRKAWGGNYCLGRPRFFFPAQNWA